MVGSTARPTTAASLVADVAAVGEEDHVVRAGELDEAVNDFLAREFFRAGH